MIPYRHGGRWLTLIAGCLQAQFGFFAIGPSPSCAQRLTASSAARSRTTRSSSQMVPAGAQSLESSSSGGRTC